MQCWNYFLVLFSGVTRGHFRWLMNDNKSIKTTEKQIGSIDSMLMDMRKKWKNKTFIVLFCFFFMPKRGPYNRGWKCWLCNRCNAFQLQFNLISTRHKMTNDNMKMTVSWIEQMVLQSYHNTYVIILIWEFWFTILSPEFFFFLLKLHLQKKYIKENVWNAWHCPLSCHIKRGATEHQVNFFFSC